MFCPIYLQYIHGLALSLFLFYLIGWIVCYTSMLAVFLFYNLFVFLITYPFVACFPLTLSVITLKTKYTLMRHVFFYIQAFLQVVTDSSFHATTKAEYYFCAVQLYQQNKVTNQKWTKVPQWYNPTAMYDFLDCTKFDKE